MSIDTIVMWHERARPKPTHRDFNVQLGCHFEEISEMLECIEGDNDTTGRLVFDAYEAVKMLANHLKGGHGDVEVPTAFRKDFLDSLADQTVTVAGVGHCAKMKIAEAVRRVNTSNWSKYDYKGEPIFNEHGRIAKGPDYAPPNLEGLY